MTSALSRLLALVALLLMPIGMAGTPALAQPVAAAADHCGEHPKDQAPAKQPVHCAACAAVFSRGEITENRELVHDHDAEHAEAYRVGKIAIGTVRDFRVAEHVLIGAGGLFSVNFVPDDLAPLYGGNTPTGAMGFVRIKLD